METPQSPTEIREALRTLLVQATGCGIQEGVDGKNWPCGTCIMGLLTDIGLDSEAPEYYERNPEPDRRNEIWRATLQIRDARLNDREHRTT